MIMSSSSHEPKIHVHCITFWLSTELHVLSILCEEMYTCMYYTFLNYMIIGVSTQGHSRAMPYQTESEEQLLLSEELTLSLKRFELIGYYYHFTLFLSFIALFTSKLTIQSSIFY